MIATLANGGVRVTPHLREGGRRGKGLAAGAASAAAIEGRRRRLRSSRRSATACGWSSTAGARAVARRIAGYDICRQDRHGAGHLATRDGQRPGPIATFATTAGSCSSPRATTRRLPASCSWNMAMHGPNAAPLAQPHSRHVFRQTGRQAAAAAPTHDDLRLDYRDPYARGATPIGGQN